MLIDGNALVHRAFHALPNLATKDGRPTGAVFGFLSIFLKAFKDIKPQYVACTFDLKGPTFRHEKYKEYKATRVKAPQELYDQIPTVKEVLTCMNVPIFTKEGYEADDVLGTLSKQLHNKSHETAEIFILTGDMDTLQLVNGKVKIYTPKKGLTDTMVYDSKAVRERFGLLPSQMVDYKALRGDPSDNIPGVKGIGEKGASELIREFESLNNLYAVIKKEIAELGLEISNDKLKISNQYQISKIKPKTLRLLVEQEKEARMSYELSKIVLDVPGISVEEIVPYELDKEHLQKTVKMFSELEFRSLVSKLSEIGSRVKGEGFSEAAREQKLPNALRQEIKSDIGKQDYQLIDTKEKLQGLIEKLKKTTEVCIDTETTSLTIQDAKLVGVGFCFEPGEAFYVPAELFLASSILRSLLTSPSTPFEKEGENSRGKINLIGHNIKYDFEILCTENCVLSTVFFDTMIASYLLNAGTRQHGLDGLAFTEFGYQMQPIEDLIGSGKTQITMDKVPVEKVSWYCGEDCDFTMRLKEVFEPQLKKEGLEKVFNEIEMPLVEVLSAMELQGIKVDTKLLNRLSGEAEILINDLESVIHKMAGREFNIASPKQLKEILFDEMKLVPVENKKTKTGLSTSADNLEKMLGQHPIIPKILEYREITKLQNTYLEALPLQVSKKTGRIHTSYNQTIAATGRLSSIDPNLQNIPVRGDGLGSQVRQAFVAEKGFKFLSLDYSQIELRVVAHLSGDEKMIEVFKKGEDIHTKTAMEIFGVSEKDVTKDMRRDAKTINFGVLYGVSSFGLSSRIQSMSMGGAKEFIKKYFLAFPKVEEYIEQIKLQVREEGFVRNELGRIRKFPEAKSSQFFIRAAAERAAVNFPIQSLAADVIKLAMISIHRQISQSVNQEIRMLLQVHDELLFEVKEDKVEYYAKIIKPLMENAIKLSVPVVVEAKVGENWGEMISIAQN